MIFSKWRPKKLCEGLTAKEFRCRCSHESCRATVINEKLVDSYHAFRLYMDMPLHITSGFRCTLHNFEVGGKPQSRHILGDAIDISVVNLLEKVTIKDVLYYAQKAGFTFTKYYPEHKFVHMDVR